MNIPFKLLLLCSLLLLSCSPRQKGMLASDKYAGTKAKNVILMIGDGMGICQITAAMYMNNNHLEIERFQNIGLHQSHGSDSLVTDSAAGATAFACGVKTYRGAVGVDANKNPVESILEKAEKKGKATGLIATSEIVHATPASFIAHVEKRYYYEDIARAFLDTEVDFFVGGGKKYFDRRISDDRNISDELVKKGYRIYNHFDHELSEISIEPDENFGFFTAEEKPLPVAQGRDYLGLATELAISHLDTHSNKGFFLMVESSQIDWGGHANNSDYIITEMLEFDRVIGKVLDWAEKDGNTLVVVTADHETGGYAILKGSEMGKLKTGFTTVKHSAEMIPVFAYGPGSELFRGIYQNSDIHSKLLKAISWK